MKVKVCGWLVVMMLVTGCGEQADIASDVKVNTDVKVETNVDVKTDVDVETDTDVTVDVGEAEPYYFTFEGTTIDGEALTSDCFAQSKLTMLNIWATYCGPCIQEMPDLGQIAAEYDRAEFQILGLISDVEEDAKESVKAEAMELIEATERTTGVKITAEEYKRPKPCTDPRLERFFKWKGCIACTVDVPVGDEMFGPELAPRAREFITALTPLTQFLSKYGA